MQPPPRDDTDPRTWDDPLPDPEEEILPPLPPPVEALADEIAYEQAMMPPLADDEDEVPF